MPAALLGVFRNRQVVQNQGTRRWIFRAAVSGQKLRLRLAYPLHRSCPGAVQINGMGIVPEPFRQRFQDRIAACLDGIRDFLGA